MIKKEDAIQFLSVNMLDRFVLYVNEVNQYYHDINTFLKLCKSSDELQLLDRYLFVIEQGLDEANNMKDFFESVIELNESVEHELAPIFSMINNCEMIYTTLASLQNIHKQNFDLFMSCLSAGCTEDEFNQLFINDKMNTLLKRGQKTLESQRIVITSYSTLQHC